MEDKILKHPLRKGEALIDSHFKLVDSTIAKELSDFSNQSQLSLPVRLHDFDFFKGRFRFDRYEFHLSYKEIFNLDENGFESILNIVSENETYSIHLPDYISKDELINPFSKNTSIKETSQRIIDTCVQLAVSLEEKTGNKCLILGSFSMNVFDTKNEFYETFSRFIAEKKNLLGIDRFSFCFLVLMIFVRYSKNFRA